MYRCHMYQVALNQCMNIVCIYESQTCLNINAADYFTIRVPYNMGGTTIACFRKCLTKTFLSGNVTASHHHLRLDELLLLRQA